MRLAAKVCSSFLKLGLFAEAGEAELTHVGHEGGKRGAQGIEAHRGVDAAAHGESLQPPQFEVAERQLGGAHTDFRRAARGS